MLMILIFIAFPVVAQPPLINRYEYWFNRQTDEKTVIEITPVLQANVQFNLSASELPDGLNSFTIRFRDSENIWSPSLSRFFVKMPVVENDSDPRQIVACEYRFNHDEMTSQSLETSSIASFDELLSTHELPDGLNSFSIRFKDNKGLWSAMLTRFFIKMPVAQDSGGTREIVAYEFGFNNGEMNYQTVTAAADISIDEGLNVAGLPDGLNSFSIRFKDSAGYWSSVLTRFLIKMPVTEYEGEENQLTNYQVWFNDDFSDVVQNSISGETAFSLIESFDTSDLPNGLNKVNIRFGDSNGRWSSVLSKFFVKNPVQESSGTNLMTAWEFWLEDAQGNTFNENGQPGRTLITLDEPGDPLLLDLNLDLRMIPHGDYFIMFRFLDTNGNWSSVLSKEVEKTIYPQAVFTASETMFCGEGTVSFSNFSIDADEYLWDFGDGNTSTDPEPVHFYETAGMFTVSLSVTWSATGQNHSLVHEDLIEVLALPEPEILASGPLEFCEGDSVELSSSLTGEYLWSTGETTVSITVKELGDYWLQLTDMNNCTGISETITVEVFDLPEAAFSFEEDYLDVFFTNESYEAVNYYWDFGDGNFSEDENPQHSFAQAGVYEVCLTAFSDAECEDTICHTFELTTSVQHVFFNPQCKVYPVPFDDFLFISLNNELNWKSLEVISSNSQRVYYQKLLNQQSDFKLETLHWSPGIYLILATTQSGETVRLKAVRK